MAEVMNMPAESLDRRRDRQSEKKEKSVDESPPPPPLPSSTLPPPPQQPTAPSRRRDRDSRERRDDREIDRPNNRNHRGGGGGGGGGDYHHDRTNRSPLPPPPLRDRDRDNRDRDRDRDRDYKRRSSPSPPPYRDRRQHSPPPFKRSRRDDGPNYDGRRGSPRGGGGGGGFGPDDRRFGYDYAGGYERGGAGGRPGYGDERPYGRHMNRPNAAYHSGPPDWDSGRGGPGGYNDASNTGNTQREGLMSYKQFIQELEDDILPAEAERRYQEYRSEYISTQKRAFFDAHKDEEWLKDKYHPTNLLTVIERRNDNARKVAKDFLLDLQSGTLDIGPGVSPTLTNKSGQASDPNSEDEAEIGGKRRRHGRGPAKENDLLLAAPKAHPVSSEPKRMAADIEQAQALVRKLDKEKGIQDNILCSVDHVKTDGEKSQSGPIIIVRGLTTVKGLEGMELLDTLITYLWRIHGLDYYGMTETNEAKGLRHVRAEGKSYDETSTAAADWENKIDSFWQGRLRGQDPLEVMTGKEKLEEVAVEALDPFVRKIRDEKYGWKYGCGAKGCTKLFHAAEFVHKHLRLKHPELVVDLTSKVREELYFQNYMNDTDAPGGTPVMQQQLPKEKPQRRRPNMDNQRLRDDRGNHHRRDQHDRGDRVVNGGGDERYDKNENSPARDVPPNTTGGGGGMDGGGGNPDEPMYDAYGGGQGMRGPPFPSDIPPPPPVLMPVPGAGPLGPFVPAPPEVAMQMLRDQGGPFDGSGGRNGRGGPHVMGGRPGPIIAVSPGFRPDPRRLRSYQDLDAPEDEVTVIDYRSL